MNQELINKIYSLKLKMVQRGITITGIFGSVAKGLETDKSDIDLLFEESIDFKKEFKGLSRVYQLELIRKELEFELGKKVDMVNKNTLGEIGKKYILKEAINV